MTSPRITVNKESYYGGIHTGWWWETTRKFVRGIFREKLELKREFQRARSSRERFCENHIVFVRIYNQSVKLNSLIERAVICALTSHKIRVRNTTFEERSEKSREETRALVNNERVQIEQTREKRDRSYERGMQISSLRASETFQFDLHSSHVRLEKEHMGWLLASIHHPFGLTSWNRERKRKIASNYSTSSSSTGCAFSLSYFGGRESRWNMCFIHGSLVVPRSTRRQTWISKGLPVCCETSSISNPIIYKRCWWSIPVTNDKYSFAPLPTRSLFHLETPSFEIINEFLNLLSIPDIDRGCLSRISRGKKKVIVCVCEEKSD